MDTFDIVASTAEAAFTTDQKGAIVAWNKVAEQVGTPHVVADSTGTVVKVVENDSFG